jgi:hypothetical protein
MEVNWAVENMYGNIIRKTQCTSIFTDVLVSTQGGASIWFDMILE